MGTTKYPTRTEALVKKSNPPRRLFAAKGSRVHLVSGTGPHQLSVAKRAQPDLSPDAKKRLKWFDHYARHGNAALTCRYFGISRQTFYRGKRRYRPHALGTLERRSSRPKRLRPRTWTPDEILAVQTIRERYPRWGKAKLQRLLATDHVLLSVSRVGRILTYLQRRGVLHEPPRRFISARKRLARRLHAVRKPPGYRVLFPGDLIQLDTVDVRPLPGQVLKQFTAHDVISRWNVLALHQRATAGTAAQALEAIVARMPFPVRAIQNDGGSEFMGEFEVACQTRGIRLFVLPPRSPKLNGAVERANRTHTEEFFECAPMRRTLAELRPRQLAWEHTYNTIRPHQALFYLTPRQFLDQYHAHRLRREEVSPR
jgi:putative transposase